MSKLVYAKTVTTVDELQRGDMFVLDDGAPTAQRESWGVCTVLGHKGLYVQARSFNARVNRRKCPDKRTPLPFFNVTCGMPVVQVWEKVEEDEGFEEKLYTAMNGPSWRS